MRKAKNPETATQFDDRPAVKDIPVSNPFNEPIEKEYSDGAGAEEAKVSLKPGETVVEHPLSPTDANPNPHGTRDEPFVSVPTKGRDGNVVTSAPDEGDVTIEATADEVHLGDGRVLRKGSTAKVSKELAASEGLKGKVKKV